MQGSRMQLDTGSFLLVFVYLTLVFAGSVEYFTRISSALWLPFLFSFVFLALSLLVRRTNPLKIRFDDMLILIFFLLFLLTTLLSTLTQRGIMITIVGLKNEIGLMVVFFVLMMDFCSLPQINRVIRTLYTIFYIQIPVVLFQVLVIIPKRVALKGSYEKWDSVAGTFGGDPMGGANTAALGMFALLIMLLEVSSYKHGTSTLKSLIFHLVVAFAFCIVAEVKFVLLISPILLVLVWISKSYLKGMKQYDVKMLLMLFSGVALLLFLAIFLLSLTYSSTFGSDPNKGVLDIFMESSAYIFDPDFIMPSGELGRMTTIFYWIKHNELYGLIQVLFGYGLNATNHGSAFSPGFVGVTYNVFLDTTALSVLLWEVGLIGTILFCVFVIYTMNSNRPIPLFERETLNSDEIRFLSYGPALNIFALGGLLTLPYSPILVIVPMVQFIFYFILGANVSIKRTLLQKANFI